MKKQQKAACVHVPPLSLASSNAASLLSHIFVTTPSSHDNIVGRTRSDSTTTPPRNQPQQKDVTSSRSRCVYDDGAAFTALAPVFCRRQRKRERAVVEVESKGLGSSLFFFSREGAPSD
jgi:hypothetical protein